MKPPRKARKKAAREAAGKKVEEHINYGSSKIKEMKDKEMSDEKKLADEMSSRKGKLDTEYGASPAKAQEQRRNSAGAAGSGMSHAGRVNASNRYDGRGSGAPVAGGTGKQVRKSLRKAVKSAGSKQASASLKRAYKKKY